MNWLKALLVLALASFLSAPAFASGKLTLKPKYDVDTGDVTWNLGLPVYQKLFKNVAYVGWLGGAVMPDHDENWVKTEQGVEAYFGRFTVGLGASDTWTPKTNDQLRQVVGTVAVTLW